MNGGPAPTSAALGWFLGVWVVMMVAMMSRRSRRRLPSTPQ